MLLGMNQRTVGTLFSDKPIFTVVQHHLFFLRVRVCVCANLNMLEHNPYMCVILGCTLQKFGTFSGSSHYSLLVGFIDSLHP